MNIQTLRTVLLCTALIMAAVISRIINTETHWFNFAPLVAISLFSGSILKGKSYAYLLPLAGYLISDLYIHFFTGQPGFYGVSQFFVYGGMLAVVLLGSFMGKPKALKVLGFSVGGTLVFWLVSNLGVFFGGYYGLSLGGLVQTYLMALPFYSANGTEFFFNALLGDLIYSGALFGIYALIAGTLWNREKALS